MTFGKKMKICLLSGLIAAFAGSILVFALSEAVRMFAVAGLIMAAVIFAVSLIAGFVLEGKPSKIRIPVFAVIIVVSVCSVLCFSLYTVGKRITFPGSFDENAYDDLCDMEDRVLEINIDGLCGWRIPASAVPESEARQVILYFGGNGENSSRKVENILNNEKLNFLHERYDFIFIDYPSYGMSEGVLTERSLEAYTLDVYNYVSSMDTTSGITLMSYSIGNGPAMYLASREDVQLDSMIMLAPYNSGYDLYNATVNVFYGPLRLLVAYKLPCYKYAREVDCPVTMIASADDEVIPIESSRNLFSSLSSDSASFITVEGIGHNDFFASADVISAIMNSLGVSSR